MSSKKEAEQVVTHQPARSFSISFQHPFNRAGGRTSNVGQKISKTMNPRLLEHAKNSPKLYGLFLLILGGVMLSFFTVIPLSNALSGADDIGWFSVKVTIVGVAVFGAGLIIAVGGRRGYEFFNPEPGRSKLPIYAVSFALVGAGFGVAIGLQKYMESLGYVFRW